MVNREALKSYISMAPFVAVEVQTSLREKALSGLVHVPDTLLLTAFVCDPIIPTPFDIRTSLATDTSADSGLHHLGLEKARNPL
jgi:hypothetical protein